MKNEKCTRSHKFHTSKRIKKIAPVQGRNDFDINRRVTIARREIGTPMSQTTHHDKPPVFHDTYIEVSNTSTLDASVEVCQHLQDDRFNENNISDIDPSLTFFDGSWQKRRYASKNGDVTCIIQEW